VYELCKKGGVDQSAGVHEGGHMKGMEGIFNRDSC